MADKVKKVMRDRNGVFDAETREAIKLELGDVLWYVAQLSQELGYDLEEVATANLNKLSSRAARVASAAMEVIADLTMLRRLLLTALVATLVWIAAPADAAELSLSSVTLDPCSLEDPGNQPDFRRPMGASCYVLSGDVENQALGPSLTPMSMPASWTPVVNPYCRTAHGSVPLATLNRAVNTSPCVCPCLLGLQDRLRSKIPGPRFQCPGSNQGQHR